jgi:acyl-CoA synthetase (AMP-forming)/AMP-acid ligase II
VARPRLVLASYELDRDTAISEVPEVDDVVVLDGGTDTDAEALLAAVRVGATAPRPGAPTRTGALPPDLDPDPDRAVAVVFTSGTTGQPKGAVFTWAQLEAIGDIDGGGRWGGGGRSLSSTSFAHLGYMTKLPQALRGGGTTFIMGRWSAGEALEMVQRHRITTLGGIPTQVALMLRHDRFDETDTGSVRTIAMGGGPSTAALVREARARFGVPVVVRYTCTEAGVGVGTAPDDPPEDAEQSVGRARRGVELTIRSDDDQVLRAGELGHVCLRSPAVMRGYWRDDEATAAVFTADGAVRTGDLGYVDEHGRLHLSGRSKEMYVRGGYNVYPLEVENVLADHPGVAHVAVVARLDPVMGEIGVAVVVPRPGAPAPTLDSLRQHGRARLAAYKLPEAVLLTDDLPRTAMEKIDRTALGTLVADAPLSTTPPSTTPPSTTPPRR